MRDATEDKSCQPRTLLFQKNVNVMTWGVLPYNPRLNANDYTGTPQKVTWKVNKERPEGHGSITYMNDCTKAKVSMEELIGRANNAGLIHGRGGGITKQCPCSRTPAPSPRMRLPYWRLTVAAVLPVTLRPVIVQLLAEQEEQQ